MEVAIFEHEGYVVNVDPAFDAYFDNRCKRLSVRRVTAAVGHNIARRIHVISSLGQVPSFECIV